jgi:SAM-dependent methyltransferase
MASTDLYRYSSLERRAPYSSLAPFYDRIMAHVGYHSWLRLVRDIFSRYLSCEHPSILEIGGGTGTLGRLLVDEAYEYIGSDRSLAMSHEASKQGIPFVCADGRHIPFKRHFDMVMFLYDGINYLLDIADYTRLCSEAYQCLRPGGLLLFDVTTETNSLRHFVDFLDFEDYDDGAYVRHSYYETSSRLQFNDFTIFCRSSRPSSEQLFEKHREHHVQKVLSVPEIVAAVPADLFSNIGIWDGFSLKKYSSRSERIHFLYRKNSVL